MTPPSKPSTGPCPEQGQVPRLLWSWVDILGATGVPRRTLERELAAGRFPRPIRRVGRRPFWRPLDVAKWAEGGGPR
jgi:hypothetical protein